MTPTKSREQRNETRSLTTPHPRVEALKINEILYASTTIAAASRGGGTVQFRTGWAERRTKWLAGSNTDAIDTIEMAANAAPKWARHLLSSNHWCRKVGGTIRIGD